VRKGEQPPWIVPDGLWQRIEPLLPRPHDATATPAAGFWMTASCCGVRLPPKLLANTRTSVRTCGKSDTIDALAVARAACANQTLRRSETLTVAAHAGSGLRVAYHDVEACSLSPAWPPGTCSSLESRWPTRLRNPVADEVEHPPDVVGVAHQEWRSFERGAGWNRGCLWSQVDELDIRRDEPGVTRCVPRVHRTSRRHLELLPLEIPPERVVRLIPTKGTYDIVRLISIRERLVSDRRQPLLRPALPKKRINVRPRRSQVLFAPKALDECENGHYHGHMRYEFGGRLDFIWRSVLVHTDKNE
jgi:hypothetical protein